MPFVNMGLEWVREEDCYKRKFRFAFFADGAEKKYIDTGVNALPPQKGSRPSLSFKEIEVQHLNEVIYYPGKPDWKPVSFTLYDIMPPGGGKKTNPVFEWLKLIYRPQEEKNNYNLCVGTANGNFKKRCLLFMLSGCGDVLEKWVFEGAWPQECNFGELDMGNVEIATCDVTLRYDRAWIETAGDNPDAEGTNIGAVAQGGQISPVTAVTPQGGSLVSPTGFSEDKKQNFSFSPNQATKLQTKLGKLPAQTIPQFDAPTTGNVVTGNVGGMQITWTTRPFGPNGTPDTYAKINGVAYPVPGPWYLPNGQIPGLPRPGKAASIKGP